MNDARRILPRFFFFLEKRRENGALACSTIARNIRCFRYLWSNLTDSLLSLRSHNTRAKLEVKRQLFIQTCHRVCSFFLQRNVQTFLLVKQRKERISIERIDCTIFVESNESYTLSTNTFSMLVALRRLEMGSSSFFF